LHVEEFLPGPNGRPPNDYKVFVADQSIAAVAVVANRGSATACVAMVNEHFERMDQYGCFSNRKEYQVGPANNNNNNNTIGNGQCRVPETGILYDDQKMCSEFAKPKDWDAILETARSVSKLIGIYMRLDLYVLHGVVYLGEATFLPTTGKHHCIAQRDDNGCLDPCITGKFLYEKNKQYDNDEGGPITAEPDYMREWRSMNSAERCMAIMTV